MSLLLSRCYWAFIDWYFHWCLMIIGRTIFSSFPPMAKIRREEMERQLFELLPAFLRCPIYWLSWYPLSYIPASYLLQAFVKGLLLTPVAAASFFFQPTYRPFMRERLIVSIAWFSGFMSFQLELTDEFSRYKNADSFVRLHRNRSPLLMYALSGFPPAQC